VSWNLYRCAPAGLLLLPLLHVAAGLQVRLQALQALQVPKHHD
jgi:hypothetical protein